MCTNANELINMAKTIRDYCGSMCGGLINEKNCPFFRGWKKSENNPHILTVECELNKGKCSPCNWELDNDNRFENDASIREE